MDKKSTIILIIVIANANEGESIGCSFLTLFLLGSACQERVYGVLYSLNLRWFLLYPHCGQGMGHFLLREKERERVCARACVCEREREEDKRAPSLQLCSAHHSTTENMENYANKCVVTEDLEMEPPAFFCDSPLPSHVYPPTCTSIQTSASSLSTWQETRGVSGTLW